MTKVPVFATKVTVGTPIQATKEKSSKKVKKVGLIRLLFFGFDQNEPMIDLVMTQGTAKSFHQILGAQLENLENELKKRGIPKTEKKKKREETGFR